MKRTNIILALLAVLTLTAQTAVGQVKTDYDLCLRDEQTGEWLIGLFNDFAVYNCEHWEYMAVNGNKLELRNGEQTMSVMLKRKGENVTAVSIDGKKHKTSVLTAELLPDYPLADKSVFTDNGYAVDTAIVRGYIIGMPKDVEIDCYVHHPLSMEQRKLTATRDDGGRFELHIPVVNTTQAFMLGSSWVLQPGETYFIYADYTKKQAFVMGRDARLQNELLKYGDILDFRFEREQYKDKSDAIFLGDCRQALSVANASLDSLMQQHPMLSHKFQVYANSRNLFCAADYLVQRWFVAPNIRQDEGQIWSYLRTEILPHTPHPYTIIGDFGYISDRYIDGLMRQRSSKFNYDYIEATLETIGDWQRNGTIHQSEAYIDSIAAMLKGMKEYQTLEQGHADEQTLANHYFPRLLQASTKDELLMQAMRTEAPERVILKRLGRLNQLDVPNEIAELGKARAPYSLIEQKRMAISEAMENFVNTGINNQHLRTQILERSNFYRGLAIQEADDEASSLMKNEPLAGLTDGKAIFDKIIAPYRGSIVYVDVWGTWCAPCKHNLQQFTKPVKEALAGLPVIYLYLCNKSSDESWRNVIREYQLTGKNCIHYNLPLEQEAAVETYLGINKYPTYILFDRQGRRVAGKEPRPYDVEKLKQMVENIKE